MLHKNTTIKVLSLDADTDFFDVVAGVLQGDTLALYSFIICPDYVLQTSIDIMKEDSFTLKKKQEANDIQHKLLRTETMQKTVLLANTPTQAEFLLHSMDQAAGYIGLHVNASKTCTRAIIRICKTYIECW